MSTIPASLFTNVIPSVLSASGAAVAANCVAMSESTRVPVGSVYSFASAAAVAAFFGSGSAEAVIAGGGTNLGSGYFGGFTNSDALPGALLFAQYNKSAVAAYLRGGDVSALTLANIQALNGVMTMAVDGKTTAASINLASATSFSNAAAIIETAMNLGASVTATVDPNVVTGTIAPNVGTGSISGTTMTISAVSTGAFAVGETVSGTGVANGTTIVAQLTGSAGSTGTYQVSISQTVTSTTITASGGTLNVSAVTSGTIAVGQTLTGTGVTSGTTVTREISGTGGTGTYAVSASQTVGSETITASGGTLDVSAVGSGVLAVGDVIVGSGVTAGNTITALGTGTGGTGTYLVTVGDTVASETITVAGAGADVSYDSVSGAFVIASTTTGASSTVAFPTGAIATSLKLTSATGATLSQGAAAQTPATAMDAVVAVTTDWVTYLNVTDPDEGSGSTLKQAFAAWKNGYPNRYAYICTDTDVLARSAPPQASTLGAILAANGDSGTCLISELTDLNQAAFVAGAAASIDFNATNGRITFAFKGQAGLVSDVTTGQTAVNLGGNPQVEGDFGNGYNYYGAVGAAAASFLWFQRGTVTGDFVWLDSYINQVVMNNDFQLALLNLQNNAKSIPYNVSGENLIETALADPIAKYLNFGAFAPGDISNAQQVAVNTAAGANVANTLQTQGYYLQILPANSTTRASRSSPPCKFWYLDRGSVQAITLDSIALQ